MKPCGPRRVVAAERLDLRSSSSRFCSGWMPEFTISASARARARRYGSLRQERRLGEALVEVLEDRQRLGERVDRAVVLGDLERRHLRHRVLRAVGSACCSRLEDVDRRRTRTRSSLRPSAMRTRWLADDAPVVVEDELHRAPPRDHALVDRAERARAVGVERLDLDAIADRHERRRRLAALDRLDHPALGEARDAARAVGVRHRAAAEDRAGGEPPRLRDVLRSDRRTRSASRARRRSRRRRRRCSVERTRTCARPSRQRVAELVGRDRERRERGRRLALEEPEALRELVGDQVAQRAVVREHDEPHVRARRRPPWCRAARRRGRRRPRTRSRGPTPDRAARSDRAGRAGRPSRPGRSSGSVSSVVGGSAPRALRTRMHVVEERRAVDPLVRARQRRAEPVRIDGHAVERAAVERLGERAQRRLGGLPVIERALERGPRIGRRRAGLAVAAHDQEPAVAGTVAEGRELHAGTLVRPLRGVNRLAAPPHLSEPAAPSARPPCRARRANPRDRRGAACPCGIAGNWAVRPCILQELRRADGRCGEAALARFL